MTDVVSIRDSDDPRDAVHRACQLLAEGELVAIPTETTYALVATALRPEGCESIARLTGLPGTLAFKVSDECRDYLGPQPPLGVRLMRRCWPGPVTLSFRTPPAEAAHETQSHFLAALPQAAQQLVTTLDGWVNFRVTGHDLLRDILKLLPGPVVLSDERWPAGAPLRTVDAVLKACAEAPTLSPALALDDGPSRYGEPSTVVRVDGGAWELSQTGVVSSRTIGRLASEVFLFACTGNTCRSPMAEAMFRKYLAEHLGCTDDELVDAGFVVLSAGLAAAIGAPASRETIEILADEGIDLRNHESQPLTERLLQQTDAIYTMTRGHREAILSERPDLATRVHMLSPDGVDVSDPIGAGMAEYQRCKQEIEKHIRQLVKQVVELRGR